MLGFLAGHSERRHVHQHEVVVRAARNDPSALLGESGRQQLGVGDRLTLVVAVFIGRGELEGHRLGGDDVHQRTALDPGEDALVHGLAQVLAAEDETAARAAQGLVRGRCHDVRVAEWARVKSRRDEAGDVGHIHE